MIPKAGDWGDCTECSDQLNHEDDPSATGLCPKCRRPFDSLDFIIAVEDGTLESATQYVNGMAEMIRSGLAWNLQGSWGRAAASMIERGYISQDGNVLRYPEE